MSGVHSKMNWQRDKETLESVGDILKPRLFSSTKNNNNRNNESRNEIIFEQSSDDNDSDDNYSSTDEDGEEEEETVEEMKITNSLIKDLLLDSKINSDTKKIKDMMERKYKNRDEIKNKNVKDCCSNIFCSKDNFCISSSKTSPRHSSLISPTESIISDNIQGYYYYYY
jgi:hypothetical protein